VKVRVTQIRSRIGTKPKAKATLDALGLRNYRSVVLKTHLSCAAWCARWRTWCASNR
jgi:hypothetical protein